MSGLIRYFFACTVVCTVAALLVTVGRLPGMLIYIAALGPAAGWIVPPHLALAIPPGLFGGALLAVSAQGADDERPRAAQVAALTLAATALAVLIVGWVMPAGYRATDAAMVRFQRPQAATSQPAPAALELPELVADGSPAARELLARRLRMVIPTLLLGLLATVVVVLPWRWSTRTALVSTIVVFVGYMWLMAGILVT